jgi:hypothetical protein
MLTIAEKMPRWIAQHCNSMSALDEYPLRVRHSRVQPSRARSSIGRAKTNNFQPSCRKRLSIPPFTPFSAFNELRRRSFARDTKAPISGFEMEGDPFLVRHASPRRATRQRAGFSRAIRTFTHQEPTSRLEPLTAGRGSNN